MFVLDVSNLDVLVGNLLVQSFCCLSSLREILHDLGPFPLVDKCLGSEILGTGKTKSHGTPWLSTFKPSTPVVVSPGRPSTNAFCTPNLSTAKREVVSGQLSISSWKSKHAPSHLKKKLAQERRRPFVS